MREDLENNYTKIISNDGTLFSTISGKGNILMKELFEYKEDISLYTARKIYGIVSYELYSKDTMIFGENPSYNIWLNNVLGHSKNNLNTAYSYSNIELLRQNLVPEELAVHQTVIDAEIDDIKDRLDEMQVPQSTEKPILVDFNNRQIKEKIDLVKEIYDKYLKDHKKKPTQTELEKLAKNITTRENIRLFYKKFVK